MTLVQIAGNNLSWTVAHEIAFINGIGSWSICGQSRKKLLLGYLVALESGRIGFSWAESIRIRDALECALIGEGVQIRMTQ